MSLAGQITRKLHANVRDLEEFGVSLLARRLQDKVFGKRRAKPHLEISTRIGPINLRPGNSDMAVLRQIFVHREYDLDSRPQGRTVRDAYAAILRRNKTPLIIDAGANVGFAARFFSQAYPLARIICVEPDPANIALCRANTKALGQIEVIEAAIGSTPGFAAIETSRNQAWATRTQRSESGLPIVTINDLASRSDETELLIVKIDIEGFEKELFSRNTEWIDQAHAVIVEPHDWLLPEAASSRTMQTMMMNKNRDLLIIGENLVWIK